VVGLPLGGPATHFGERMAQRLIEMKFIAYFEKHKPGDVEAVTRGQAAIWEALGVAIRVRPPHSNTKPIGPKHTVTKGE